MQFSYDNLGRMTTEQWLAANGGGVENTITVSYDVASQLTAISDDASSYAYTYDSLGRVASIDNNSTPNSPRLILTNAYDAVSNRTSVTANVAGGDDFVNTWQYASLDRTTQVTQTRSSAAPPTLVLADKRVDLTYNERGQCESRSDSPT